MVGAWSDDDPIVISDYDHQGNLRGNSGLQKLFAFMQKLPRLLSSQAAIRVDDSVRQQTIMGFGGAMSFAAGFVIGHLPEPLQQFILESYFSDRTGIGYSITRISIGGSDFDLAPWAYNESPRYDKKLSNFTRLDPRTLKVTQKIQQIKDIMRSEGRVLKVKAAAWNCPPWMRTPERWAGNGELKKEYYQTWADYHVRFLELLKKEADLDVWAISTGNEPTTSLIELSNNQWMSLGWWPATLADYVADNLGPTLRRSQFNATKIILGEDQRYLLPWAYQLMEKYRPETFDYIDGIGLHSYFDFLLPSVTVDWTKESFPEKFLLNTEYSVSGYVIEPAGPSLGNWDRAHRYIATYMDGLSHQLSGFIDWNLVLDEIGGPTYIKNYLDSAIIGNATGREAYKQPIFYAIGHFSKFLPEGSIRIKAQSDWDKVTVVSFLRPDNEKVLILYNEFSESVSVAIEDTKRGTKVVEVPPVSITTVVYAV